MKINRDVEYPVLETERPFDRIIDKILGPGVTIIGSHEPFYRYRLQEQIALAVSKGEPFLGCFQTRRRTVAILRNGLADWQQTKQWLAGSDIVPQYLFIEKNKYHLRIESSEKEIISQNPSGILGYIKQNINKAKVFIIPDLWDISIKPKDYLNQFLKHPQISDQKITVAINEINSRIDIESISKLRGLAAHHHISIVTGHNLSTRNNFQYSPGPTWADNKLRLVEKSEFWELIITGSIYVPTANYRMEFSDFTGFSLTKKEGQRMNKSRINDKEKHIIDFMSGKGRLRLKDIEKGTQISHSTLYQRLEGLQSDKKNNLVFKNSDGTYELIRNDIP